MDEKVRATASYFGEGDLDFYGREQRSQIFPSSSSSFCYLSDCCLFTTATLSTSGIQLALTQRKISSEEEEEHNQNQSVVRESNQQSSSVAMTLQASLFSVGIPTFAASPPPTPRRISHVIRAKMEPSEKSVEIMRKFSEQYARRSGTYFCVDKGVTSVVIKGLADHKDSLGAPLCPCRHYDDKPAEAGQGFWNCPCVPMRERKECHCMLFLTPDNDFAGKDQTISMEEIKESTTNM